MPRRHRSGHCREAAREKHSGSGGGPHSLGRRLKNFGIRPRTARNAFLMDIPSQLPAALFSSAGC